MKIACTLNYVRDAVEVNRTFDATNDKYKLEMCNLSQRAVDALSTQFTIKAKEDDKKGLNINAKSKYPFVFVDDVGNPVDAQTIGNGSKAIVDVTGSYDHKFAKKYGFGPIAFSTVVVTELIPYASVPKDNGEVEVL